MKDAISDSCSNSAGISDQWTSPCCYADMPNKSEGEYDCPECGRRITCTIDYEPVCTARIADDDGEEE